MQRRNKSTCRRGGFDITAMLRRGGRSKARRSTCRRGGRLAASFEIDTRWGAPGRN